MHIQKMTDQHEQPFRSIDELAASQQQADTISALKTSTNTLKSITEWHRRARPTPTDKDFTVQLGCHLEEVCEMLEALTFDFPETKFPRLPGKLTAAHHMLHAMAKALKASEASASIADREALVDSLADQIVTAVGVGHCTGMDVELACLRVDESNWSKFVDGKPQFDRNGKVDKPLTYRKPDLTGCY